MMARPSLRRFLGPPIAASAVLPQAPIAFFRKQGRGFADLVASAEKHVEDSAIILKVASEGDCASVDANLRQGQPIEGTDFLGTTPLIAACANGHAACVQLLLDRGADPNAQKNNGDAPIHIASYLGNKPIVQMLLAAGANLELPGDLKNRALHLACQNGKEDVAHLLLLRGASVLAKNEYGNMPSAICHPQAPGVRAVLATIEKGGEAALRKMRQERAERLAKEAHALAVAEGKRREAELAAAAAAEAEARDRTERAEAARAAELQALQDLSADLQAEVNKFRHEQEERDRKIADDAAAKEAAAEKAKAKAAAGAGGKAKGKKK